MNETDPNHFTDVVTPLREAYRNANKTPSNKQDVIQQSVDRCKRHSNQVKNCLNRHGSLFKLDQLTEIEADLQAALADIAILKPDATND
jgi:hypothetical protein